MSLNPFESGTQKVIPAVLVYIFREDQVLMIHRNAVHPGRMDDHQGKWNGLGGKCELGESPLEAAQREIKEEAALDIPQSEFRPLGVLQFPNFKAHKNEDWMVFVFVVQLNAPNPKFQTVSSEGELHWVPWRDMTSLNLWPGDRLFISYVMERRPFMGTIWYQNSQVVKNWITPIES